MRRQCHVNCCKTILYAKSHLKKACNREITLKATNVHRKQRYLIGHNITSYYWFLLMTLLSCSICKILPLSNNFTVPNFVKIARTAAEIVSFNIMLVRLKMPIYAFFGGFWGTFPQIMSLLVLTPKGLSLG